MEIILPNLKPWQKDVLLYYDKNTTGKWCITKSPRQVGKSALIAILLIYASLKEIRSWSLCVSPVRAQAKKLFDDVCNIAHQLVTRVNGTQLEIKFINGSTVKFCSAEMADNVRGYTTKKSGILCVDECAFVKDDFFYNILVPITNVNHSDIFVFSTPRFKQGVFFDLFMKGLSDDIDNIVAFDWTKYDLSDFLPDYLLNMYREQLPKLTFRAEYLGEFIEGEGSVFNNFNRCVGPYIPDKNRELFISIDWSSGGGGDYTVITIGQDVDNMISIERQIAFNDKSPQVTIDYICDIVSEYITKGFKELTIIVEKNSIGAVYHSMLVEKIDGIEVLWNDTHNWNEEIKINCTTFTTTNQSKKRAVERLEILFEQNRIIIPNDKNLMNELSSFDAKINSLGTVQYSAPNGLHDDRVLSLLFMVDRLYVQKE